MAFHQPLQFCCILHHIYGKSTVSYSILICNPNCRTWYSLPTISYQTYGSYGKFTAPYSISVSILNLPYSWPPLAVTDPYGISQINFDLPYLPSLPRSRLDPPLYSISVPTLICHTSDPSCQLTSNKQTELQHFIFDFQFAIPFLCPNQGLIPCPRLDSPSWHFCFDFQFAVPFSGQTKIWIPVPSFDFPLRHFSFNF